MFHVEPFHVDGAIAAYKRRQINTTSVFFTRNGTKAIMNIVNQL